MPGLYIVLSSEKEKEEEEEKEKEKEEDGLVMLRIWYFFKKVVKVIDGILEVYSLSLIRFDDIGDHIGEDRKYE